MPGKKKRKQKDFGQNSVDVSSTHEVNNNLQSTDRRASFPLNSGQLYNINNNGIGGGRKNYKRLSSDTDQLIQTAGRVASGKRGSAESWESIANAADVTKQGASDFDNDVKLPAEYILMGDMAHNKRRVSGHRNSYK